MPFKIIEATIDDIKTGFANGTLTAQALVQMYLDRIAAYDQQGPMLNGIITINPDAMKQAEALDKSYQETGPVGALHGIPVIIKDNINTKDMPTTGGCDALRYSVPPEDAYVVQKLQQAGAIILAKSSLSEFALGSIDTINSILPGFTRNPYHTAYASGGSSGGTGIAIAANFASVGLGTDTGMSVRSPASINCLFGLRPTHGLISCNGVIPLSVEWDTVGPIARNVTDLAYLLDSIVGYDPVDPYTAKSQGKLPNTYTVGLIDNALQEMRIGVLRQNFIPDDSNPEVLKLTDKAISDMHAAGAEIFDPVDIPEMKVEFNTGHYFRRFKHDLKHYLDSLGPKAVVHSMQDIIDSGKVHPFTMEKLKRYQSWPYSLEDDPKLLEKKQYDHQLKSGILTTMDNLKLDTLVFPTYRRPPRKIGDRYTLDGGGTNKYASITGFPALVVPMGFVSPGLPVSLQFIGRPWSEAVLIQVGYGYEQYTQHRMPPPTCPDLSQD